tara:strand:- start:1426 stop:1701 length:276 start_codon:yes stop_codon:yes gene_type:complete
MEEKLREKVLEQLPEEDKLVDGHKGVSTEFMNSVYIMSKGDFCRVTLKFQAKYRKKKKDGTQHRNETTNEFLIHMNNCPFCGTKFEGREAA